MSGSEPSEDDRQKDRVNSLFDRYMDQGLVSQPLEVEGFLSFRGNRVREVDGSGER